PTALITGSLAFALSLLIQWLYALYYEMQISEQESLIRQKEEEIRQVDAERQELEAASKDLESRMARIRDDFREAQENLRSMSSEAEELRAKAVEVDQVYSEWAATLNDYEKVQDELKAKDNQILEMQKE